MNRLISSACLSPLLHQHKNALIISCGESGKAIAKRLGEDGYVTIATTKPRRTSELTQFGRVVCVPQIENKDDEILTENILKSDVVILADTIKIFQPSHLCSNKQ